MDIPQLGEEVRARKIRRSDAWQPVINGQVEPDAWQQALMDAVKKATVDEKLFYTTDVHKYVQEHNDFVPPEFWDLQFTGTPVEGGVMGMELYYARDALEKAKERAEDDEALKLYQAGQKLGTLYINGKRVTGAVVMGFDGRFVIVQGNQGRVRYEWRPRASSIQHMIDRARQRKWRK